MRPNSLLDLTVISVLAGLMTTACSTKKPDSEPPSGKPSNPWLEADLASWRVKGRREMPLGDVAMLYADRIIKHPDGTATATGHVYAEGLASPPDGKLGWPAHTYANGAEWVPGTQTLELKGWPVLEYRKSQVISARESTTMLISPGSLKIHGPSSMRLITEEKKEAKPAEKDKGIGE
ncbi:hypothetical protein [Brevifollis gellanilyticus]|uniref:LPS export ABC transporter periplasmic protein LptC n=1 Tax=Brevifollis gellanilyticus TaxID=748831 RepID=A0A512MI88_9BACT|nr:hypothetical protein [Brevifollis gellanilyticus]GEP46452.1 hypothetical protein BGE01nite_57430 [Brevifollis gellanilyticus]